MKRSMIMFAFALTLVTGCTTTTATTLQDAPNTAYGEVTFYRTNQLQGSVSDTYIGWNGDYYHTLAVGEQITTRVPTGFVNLSVKAKLDVANELVLEVQPNQQYCVSVEVNPSNIVLVNWFVPSYQLKSIPCPTQSAR
jgi:hypothetical protein